jgi:hypothetical protein
VSLQAWHTARRLETLSLVGPVRARAEELAPAIAAAHRVFPHELLEGRGHERVWRARRELYLRLWREGHPIATIAKALDKHHTSITHGLQRKLGKRAYLEEMRERFPIDPKSYRGAPWAA